MKRSLVLSSITAVLFYSASASSFAAGNQANLYGQAVAPDAANSTVVIGADTNYVNVTKGDTVKFVCGDKTFAWHFNEVSTLSEVNLNDIAPRDMLTHTVKIYLRRNPATDGG